MSDLWQIIGKKHNFTLLHLLVFIVWITCFILFNPSTCFVIGTGYLSRYSDWLRAGRSEIESRWGRDFPLVQTGPVAHPASCKMGTGSFPGVKCGRVVLLITHSLLMPQSWKRRDPLGHTGPVTGSLHFSYLFCCISMSRSNYAISELNLVRDVLYINRQNWRLSVSL